MLYPQQILDDIKNRIRLSEIIGRYVKLTKRGSQFVGLSPFNNEKTPSFFVNDQKQFYHCFSSDRGGDVFQFLMETRGMSFHEAVTHVAEITGVSLPKNSTNRELAHSKQKNIYEVLKLAKNFFVRQREDTSNIIVNEYIHQRGLKPQIVKDFQLGFATSGEHDLKRYLAQHDVEESIMQEAGLIIVDEQSEKRFDRFRNRLIFPIVDIKGRCIAFGGRALSPTAKAKYLNSPETPIFKKRHTLYNLNNAKEAIFKKKRLIVVEGYMDVINLSQAGFEETVAPLGTAISLEQINLMWRYNDKPILCFDGDTAGQKAVLRMIEKIFPELKPGFSIQFISLENSLDPDDYVRLYGREAFEEKIQNAESLDNYVWYNFVAKYNLDTPENRAKCEVETNNLINTIQNPLVRQHYQKDFKTRFFRLWRTRSTTDTPFRSFSQQRRGMGNKKNIHFVKDNEAKLLAYLLYHPKLIEENVEQLIQLTFTTPEYRKILHDIIEALANISPNNTLDCKNLEKYLETKGHGVFLEQLKKSISFLVQGKTSLKDEVEIKDIKEAYSLAYNYHRKSTLLEKLQQEKDIFAKNFSEQSLNEIQALKKEIDLMKTHKKEFINT